MKVLSPSQPEMVISLLFFVISTAFKQLEYLFINHHQDKFLVCFFLIKVSFFQKYGTAHHMELIHSPECLTA